MNGLDALRVTARARPEASLSLQFDPAEIPALAARYEYEDDSECVRAGAHAAARGYYTRGELRAVCAWKTARAKRKVAANSFHRVRAASGRALADQTDDWPRIQALCELLGVGVPTASVLLHFAFPDRYPIIDYRALESLGVPKPSTYSATVWLGYAAACREIAGENRVPLRVLDKALWQHSKEHGGA